MNIATTSTKTYCQVVKECHHNIINQAPKAESVTEYDGIDEAVWLARTIIHFMQVTSKRVNKESHIQQYLLKKGLKLWGQQGYDGAKKELKQQHERQCFRPIHVSKMSPSEKKKAQEALMFLAEKRSGEIKGRMVYNGKPMRPFYDKEDTASPTATLEGIFITTTINAHEE